MAIATANDNEFALALWEASQHGMVQTFAYKLWGSRDGAQEGIQEALIRSITRKDWYDPTRGKLTTWLLMQLKSVRQAERSRGHRRGTVSEPRVVYPGDEAIPDLIDLCDPELILIARETDWSRRKPRDYNHGRKLTQADLEYLRGPGRKVSATVLAKRLRVNRNTIYNARNGLTYTEAA